MATSGNFNSGNNFTYSYGGISITCNASWLSSITRQGTASKASVNLAVTVRHVSGDESGYAMYYSEGDPATSPWILLASNNQTHYVGGSTTLNGTYTKTVGNAAGTLTGYVIIAVGQTATSYVYYQGQYSLSYPAKTSYTIAYNANGGSGSVSSQTKYYGESLKLRSNSYTWANHNFLKWNTAADGSGTDYVAGASYTANKAATLYAQWETLGSTASVTFDNSTGVAAITVSKTDESYTHSLGWQFGALSGYIDSSGSLVSAETIFSGKNITATFTLSDLYQQIPNSDSGTLVITVKTYNGSTYVGATTTNTTVTVPATIKPSISGQITTDQVTQNLTGSTTTVIKDATYLTITWVATTSGWATLREILVNGVSYGTPSGTFTVKATSGNISIVAVDSRGRSSDPMSATYTLINYTVPVVAECTASRVSASSTDLNFRISGTAWYGNFRTGYTNAIKVTYTATSDGSSADKSGTIGTATISSDGSFVLTATVSGFTYAESWKINITVNDGTSSIPLTFVRVPEITGPPGVPVFDWGESDFNFNVPVTYTDANGDSYPLISMDKLSADQNDFSAVSVAASTATDLGSITLQPGYWILVVSASFASNSTGNRNIRLASTSEGSAMNDRANVQIRASTSAQTRIQLVYTVKLTTATTFYVVAYHNGSAALNVTGGYIYIGLKSE